MEGLFVADRISRDPRFGESSAACRFANWLQDIVDGGGALLEVFRDDEAVGFFTLREVGPGRFSGELNGLYSDARGQGLGRHLHLSILGEVKHRRGTHYSSQVSSNNIPALRAAIAAGLRICEVNYVFVRHRSSIDSQVGAPTVMDQPR